MLVIMKVMKLYLEMTNWAQLGGLCVPQASLVLEA